MAKVYCYSSNMQEKGWRMVFVSMVLLNMMCLASLFSEGGAVLIQGLPAADQVDALLHLKTLLSPHSQMLLDGWNASNADNVCTSWVGVHCTAATPAADNYTHLNIYSINLTGLGLSGMLAPQIGNLSSVSVLDLSNNSLTGSIPEQLSSCTSLTVLNLGSNSFHGAIPSSLSSLTSLQVLRLFDNHLSGDIPYHLLLNCTSLIDLRLHHNSLRGSIPSHIVSPLRWLVLHENNFTGLIPPALSNFTSLVYLILYTNQLIGPIPSELGLLHSLQQLAFSENHLTGAIPRSLANCSSLTDLILYANLLTGSIPSDLGFLGNLKNLYLHFQYNLTGAIPQSLGNCSSLAVLSLYDNHLTGPVPSELGLLSHLYWLLLYKNYLSGAIPHSLSNCTNLATLQMQSNQLSGSIPTELTTMGLLENLFLSSNHLSGSLSLTFSNFSSLYVLSLYSNQFTGPIPEEFGHMEKLQILDLGNNSFSSVIPWPALSNCSFLYKLNLSSNHLIGAGFPSNPGRLQALRELFLQRNLLEGATPHAAQGFNYFNMGLLELDVSSNRLNGSLPSSLVSNTIVFLSMENNEYSGSLPPWLGQLVQLQGMSLAHNNFTGTIPESIGQCLALTSLDLSHNHLIGDIPQHLINLTFLESLDVSSNNLTGILPAFLENFSHLQFLDVSFNNFTGAIPLLGVFKHLNASSFQGNPELCGPVIKKACVQSSKTHHHHSAHQLSWKKALPIALASSLLGAVFILALCHYLKCIQRFQGGFSQTHETAGWLQEVERYSAEELAQATQGYSEGNLLGQGALAQVYKGVLPYGKFVAVKKFKEVCFREALLQEVRILSKLRHRNLVRVLGCVLNLDINALVLEYMSNGSLEQYLHPVKDANESQELSWRVLLEITNGVAKALAYLHHEFGIPIIHGDVKPGNILLDSSLEAHLADFGLAKLANNGIISVTSGFKGSIGYMAPEYAYAAGITTKVDVYSFGVVILEMLTGRRPTSQFPGSMNLHEWVKMQLLNGVGLEEVLHANSRAPLLLSATNDCGDVMHLIKLGVACTSDQPNKRPTMQEVVALLHSTTMS